MSKAKGFSKGWTSANQGISVGFPWTFYWVSMICLWFLWNDYWLLDFYGLPMEFPWCFYDISGGFLWDLGIWSIMATIRWCPIAPKWDIYQPLVNQLQIAMFNSELLRPRELRPPILAVSPFRGQAFSALCALSWTSTSGYIVSRQ